ncbi:MAG: hypothetical protein JO267_08230 [Alphaproteobacteria bacterium]|nr:hypothetical protein [Alphaproteobacteria bacterium]MBV9862123.1 hypothetical protein [Alphaproteobacteria bacterium]
MSSVAASVADSDLPVTACFSVQAYAEPGVLPRLVELFAKRGLVPGFWRSVVGGAGGEKLTVEIQMRGLGRDTMNYMAACMRQIAAVETVLTAEMLGGP